MKRIIMILVSLALLMAGLPFKSLAAELVWQDIGRGVSDVKSVLIDPEDVRIIYVGSSEGVFKSEDAGVNWRRVFSLGAGHKNVNLLLFDPTTRSRLYAATVEGFFCSDDSAETWKRIFSGKDSAEKECTSAVVLSSGIFLGTKKGLFVSRDKGRTWQKAPGQIGNIPVLAISGHNFRPNDIYAATLDGAYKTDDAGKSWEKIFGVHPVENGNNGEEEERDQDEEERFSGIRHICVDPEDLDVIYLATDEGVTLSKDKGKTWSAMTGAGLLHREVQYILSTSAVFAVTKSGVFEFRQEGWHELSSGLIGGDIWSLAQDSRGFLYAACERGVFKSVLRQANVSPYDTGKEPGIRKVQQAAIEYAEVAPEKIKLWRRQAARKAVLPRVTIGVDRDTSDLWHWEGGSTTKTDDDILRRGRDSLDWDITLSWDLSELIWSSDQASIDVRSRLMVELRDDILDEVTKIYFERLRVKNELDSLPIEDRKKRWVKELRLQELTALLDALTGGYFSQHLAG
ncbi:MAG: hypothetical protein V1923_02615 [Candidatus Omnitrophota bacterium]